MGRDFRINGIDSTYKPVSYCMYKALKLNGYFKDEDDLSDVVKPKDLAKIIVILENAILNEYLSDKFIKEFKFYDNETEEDILEHLKEVNDKFKSALAMAVAINDKISVNYS